ncbi:MAG TPA: aminotransferase class IV [Flavisolibacter sp.]|nr:aminotransferase class IV [Flavisolibacter sp.]
MMKICSNGEFYPADTPLLAGQNRSFKWGDGLFETAKLYRGRLLLADLHFERLFSGLKLLQINCSKGFTQDNLVDKIITLCTQNNCLESARIRLAVYRTDENTTGFLIEASNLDEAVNRWQDDGLTVCLYPHARKSMDAFANIKSAAYLPYILAQRFASEKGVDDTLVLNAANLICDSAKANVFLIKGNTVCTPALHQGCINGIMRRIVMGEVKRLGYRLRHDEVSEEVLLAADEVFLTNAIQIIRWVKSYKSSAYGCEKTRQIFEAVSATIFSAPC